MSSTVWKASLNAGGETILQIPAGARLLHFDVQYGIPTMWFLCDPDVPSVQRRVLILGTGHTTPYPPAMLHHVGTALLQGDSLVLHAFEVQP